MSAHFVLLIGEAGRTVVDDDSLGDVAKEPWTKIGHCVVLLKVLDANIVQNANTVRFSNIQLVGQMP
jgi:hypothetical protein